MPDPNDLDAIADRRRAKWIGRADRADRRAEPCLIAVMLTASTNWNDLADRALAGELISRDDARAVLAAPDELLLDQLAAAYRVRRHYHGNRVRLHFLLNAQSGLCPEDCHYCSQSSVSGAEIEKYPFMAREKILAAAERAASLNVGTFCMVISGRTPGGRVFDKVLDAVREVKSRYDMNVCACLGLLTEDHVRQLEEAGVDQVNHNLNSSARFHDEIVTTHTFDDRVATVEHVARSGMKTCSGGIIGMGESDEDVIDLALSLRELDVRSVPVNFLIPIPGTPFEARGALDPRRCLRVLASTGSFCRRRRSASPAVARCICGRCSRSGCTRRTRSSSATI